MLYTYAEDFFTNIVVTNRNHGNKKCSPFSLLKIDMLCQKIGKQETIIYYSIKSKPRRLSALNIKLSSRSIWVFYRPHSVIKTYPDLLIIFSFSEHNTLPYFCG